MQEALLKAKLITEKEVKRTAKSEKNKVVLANKDDKQLSSK